MSDRLEANQQLNIGDRITAPNGKTFLVQQGDGNLVLYRTDNGKPLWASNTWGKPVTHAIMQPDGNLVCYDNSGHAYWAAGTWGHPGCDVVLQDDGNLVIYSPTRNPLWATNTLQDWNPFDADTGDVHVGTGEWMHSWASVASTGLISGHTHTWCTIDLRGFHGSVVAILLDGDGKTIWPPNPQVTKHQYGV